MCSPYSGWLAFQTIIAAAADNYIYRTVKFASGVFIPVIEILSRRQSRVSGGGVVKSTTEAVGLVTVMSLVLPPVIYVMCISCLSFWRL